VASPAGSPAGGEAARTETAAPMNDHGELGVVAHLR